MADLKADAALAPLSGAQQALLACSWLLSQDLAAGV
jgi:hypothetical protein